VQSRKERSAEIDGKILTAAVRFVSQRGWEFLTVDRVAAAAHVSERTVYNRWPTVDELRGSAVAQAFADIAARINAVERPWGPSCMASVERIVADAPATTLISWWTASRSSAMPQEVRDGVEWGWRTVLAAIKRVTKRRGGQASAESLIWVTAREQSSSLSPKPIPPLLTPVDVGIKPSDDQIYAAWAAWTERRNSWR
jgi:AcrR family transcriptional regulator